MDLFYFKVNIINYLFIYFSMNQELNKVANFLNIVWQTMPILKPHFKATRLSYQIFYTKTNKKKVCWIEYYIQDNFPVSFFKDLNPAAMAERQA